MPSPTKTLRISPKPAAEPKKNLVSNNPSKSCLSFFKGFFSPKEQPTLRISRKPPAELSTTTSTSEVAKVESPVVGLH